MFYGRNCFKRGASAAIFTCGVFYLTLNLLYHYLAVVKKTDGEVPGEETRAQDPRSFSKEDLTFLDEMNNRMFKRKTLLKNACKGLGNLHTKLFQQRNVEQIILQILCSYKLHNNLDFKPHCE